MSDKVAQPTKAATALREQGKPGKTLMGGTSAMRDAGTDYLPQFEGESDTAYKARKKASWLFNGYRKTVRDMSGMVFAKSVEITEGNLDEAHEANIDGQGNDLSTFAKNVFEDGLGGAGISFIMVDAPRREGDVTKEQAKQAALRPYFVHLTVDEVLGWRTETKGSDTYMSQFRVMETVEEPDPDNPFDTKPVDQVRVLTREGDTVTVQLYRKVKDGTKEVWAIHEEFASGLGEITVAPFYAQRTGYMAAEPPLSDLADVNIAHWQSQSDQRNILHFARVPILTASGYEDDDGKAPLRVSAGTATTSSNEQFKMEWVEHSGQAIGAGRQDLKDLEFQMQALGLQLLVATNETATGAVLDAQKETAPLAMMADQMKDTLEQCLAWFAKYEGRDEAFAVVINKDYGITGLTSQEMTAMLAAVNTGNMSRETFLKEMARRGAIAEDTDVAEEIDRIDAEGGGLTDDMEDVA